jgi:hypothetical protein
MRCARKDGGKGADAFETEDAARLDSGLVNGGDGERMAVFEGWVAEEVGWRWEVEGVGRGDKA